MKERELKMWCVEQAAKCCSNETRLLRSAVEIFDWISQQEGDPNESPSTVKKRYIHAYVSDDGILSWVFQ